MTTKEAKEKAIKSVTTAKQIDQLENIKRRAVTVLSHPEFREAQRQAMQASFLLGILRAAQPARPRRYTVHHPNKSGGFSQFDTDYVLSLKGDSIASGPILVAGNRRLKCNVRDNQIDKWVRVDYRQLRDWEKGVMITYEHGNALEQPWGRALRQNETE